MTRDDLIKKYEFLKDFSDNDLFRFGVLKLYEISHRDLFHNISEYLKSEALKKLSESKKS